MLFLEFDDHEEKRETEAAREAIQRNKDEEVGEVGGRDKRTQQEVQDMVGLLRHPCRRRTRLRHRRLLPQRPFRSPQLPRTALPRRRRFHPTRQHVRRLNTQESHPSRRQSGRPPNRASVLLLPLRFQPHHFRKTRLERVPKT